MAELRQRTCAVVMVLGSILLAGCSNDGTPVPSPEETPSTDDLSQAEATETSARNAVREAERLLQAATTEPERQIARLRLAAASADLTTATARVNFEKARAEIRDAETLVRTASTTEERNAIAEKLTNAERLLREAEEGADDAGQAATAATDGAAQATAAVRADAQAVRRRAAALIGRIAASQLSVSRQIQALRRQISFTATLGPDAGAPGSRLEVGTADITRYARTNSDGTAVAESERLSIAQKAVPYTDGKRVISPDITGTTDEFPLRAITVRTGWTTGQQPENYNVRVQGNDRSPNTYSETDAVPIASIHLEATRVVYKFGGEGVAFHDNQRDFGIGSSIDAWRTQEDECGTEDLGGCYDWNSFDLSIAWSGIPGSAPNGEPVFYWSSRVPLPEGQSGEHPNLLQYFSKDRPVWDLGLYELWVTNYGGLDRGLEPSNAQGLRYPRDDEPQYLKYAAYGMFVHTDTLAELASSNFPGRVQGFHFGYDAFENAEDKRTTDISAPATLTFNGRTMALMHQHFSNHNPLRVDLRADITLQANIGEGANTISGEFSNFEKLSPEGVWVRFDEAIRIRNTDGGQTRWDERLVIADKEDYFFNHRTYPNDYTQYGAMINADGSYEAGVYHQYWDGDSWERKSWSFWSSANGGHVGEASTLNGNLYGPRDDLSELETAGYWYIAGDPRKPRWGGIVGSFGAVQQPD